MTEKRFSRMTNHYGTSRTYCTGVYDNQNNRELKNVNQVITELNALHEENEQLKSTIKKVTELLSDEVDVFSEKATEHDIIAYVELKELDNKDAFYMATATKEAIRMLKELQE